MKRLTQRELQQFAEETGKVAEQLWADIILAHLHEPSHPLPARRSWLPEPRWAAAEVERVDFIALELRHPPA